MNWKLIITCAVLGSASYFLLSALGLSFWPILAINLVLGAFIGYIWP